MERHEDLAPLAETMRAFRKAAGYTQEAFANAAHLDRGFVGAVERAERNVGFRKVRALLVGLRVTWRDFGAALDDLDPLRVRSEAEYDAAITQLRDAIDRQRNAMLSLCRALVQRLTADQQFAVLALNEAGKILPCTFAKLLERIARGAALEPLCNRLARDRRLLDLVRGSRPFREAAIRHAEIAACMAECSAAGAAANAAGKYLRTHFRRERRPRA